MRENIEFDDEFDEKQPKLWKSVVFWQNMCGALRCKHSDDKCDNRFVEGTDTHATLEYLYKHNEEEITFC